MTEQLTFGLDAMFETQASAHLPDTIEAAVPVYRQLLADHHRATLAGDSQTVTAIHDEAYRLLVKLNGNTNMGVRCEGAPGCVLPQLTAAPRNTVPLWGQQGDFVLTIRQTRVRIEWAGLFGICGAAFSAHVVDVGRPFISETGYRSFLTGAPDIQPHDTPDLFVRRAIEAHIDGEMKGKLVWVAEEYRKRARRLKKAA